MADQPLNADISIFRRVRTQRSPARHDSVKNITHKLRNLVLVAPNEEIKTQVIARDADTTDFSAFMGQANALEGRGFPVVIGVRALKDVGAVESITSADFFVEIGHDKFVQERPSAVGGDLHQAARDA